MMGAHFVVCLQFDKHRATFASDKCPFCSSLFVLMVKVSGGCMNC